MNNGNDLIGSQDPETTEKPVENATPAPEAKQAEGTESTLTAQKAERDEMAKRAMLFLQRIKSNNYQQNDEMLRKECYETEDALFGTHSEQGRMWRTERLPIGTAKEHAEVLKGIITKGYSKYSPEGYAEWTKAWQDKNRAELIRLSGVKTQKMASTADGNGGFNAFFDSGMGVPNTMVDRDDAEIDADLDKYNAKMMAANFMQGYRLMRPEMSEEALGIVDRAIQRADGMDPADEQGYLALDPMNRARVKYLINQSRVNTPAWWVDLGGSLYDMGRNMVEGTVGLPKMMANDLAARRGVVSAWEERIRKGEIELTPEEQAWMDKARAEQEAEQKEAERYGGLAIPSSAYSPYSGVAGAIHGIAMRRSRDEQEAASLVYRKERDRMRSDELDLRLLEERRPYDDYAWWQDAISGAVTTLPYMAEAAIPVAGTALVAMQQFENVRDRMIEDGFDPSGMGFGAQATQMALATAYAFVEKLQMEGVFGKPLTAMGYRSLISTTAKNMMGKMKDIGGKFGKEWLATTLSESIEEGLQGGIERGTIAAFEGYERVGTVDEKTGKAVTVGDVIGKTISEIGNGIAEDFTSSLGTMGVIALFGIGRKGYRAATGRFNQTDIAEYAANSLKMRNMLTENEFGGKDLSEEDRAKRAERGSELINKAALIWRQADSKAQAAADIEDMLGIDERSTRLLCEFMAERDAVLSNITANDLAGASLAASYGTDNIMDALYRFGKEDNWGKVEEFFKNYYLNQGKNEADAAELAKNQVKIEQDLAAKGVNYRSPEGIFSESKKLDPVAFMRTFINPDVDVEAAEIMVDGKKMTGNTFVIPIKMKDGTVKKFNLFSVVRDSGKFKVNMGTEGFAGDVADYNFPLLDKKGKIKFDKNGDPVMLTKEAWLGMTDARRKRLIGQYRKMYNNADLFKTAGSFNPTQDLRIVSADGKTQIKASGIINLFNGTSDTAKASTNQELAHEISHAVVRFAREAGAIGEGEAAVMRELFGEAKTNNELWDEESMAKAFEAYLRGKFDFGTIPAKHRGLVQNAFEAVRKFVQNLFATFGVDIRSEKQKQTDRRAAIDAVWEGIRSGDFTKLSQFSGVRFETPEEAEIRRNGGERHALVTPEEDASYMDAVNRGDMDAAQEMVRKAAAKAMPNTFVRYEDGLPIVMMHETRSEEDFHEFDLSRSHGVSGQGFYFTNDEERLPQSGTRIINAFLDIDEDKVFDYDARKKSTQKKVVKLIKDELKRRGVDFDERSAKWAIEDINGGDEEFEDRLQANQRLTAIGFYEDENGNRVEGDEVLRSALIHEGYEGVYDEDVVAFYPWQIKSADPVTYDDNGNVIPLSKRFDQTNPDIRYSLIGGELKAEDDYLAIAKNALGNRDWKSLSSDDKLKIKLSTGWEVGADGKWRKEMNDVDDTKLANIVNSIKEGKYPYTNFMLGEVIDEDVLKNYKMLTFFPVRFFNDNRFRNRFGFYDGTNKFIYINPRLIKNASVDDIKEVLVHEVQHAIQRIEGFAVGGSSTDADYNSFAGEVEARNASRRTSAEGLLEDTEDVPRDNQVFRVNGNGVADFDAIYMDDLLDDQLKLAIEGKKKYETRYDKLPSRVVGVEIGALSNVGSKNGRKNILRAMWTLGEPVLRGKDSVEYKESMINRTPFDMADGEKKWFYPIKSIRKVDPIDVRGHVINSPVFGQIEDKFLKKAVPRGVQKSANTAYPDAAEDVRKMGARFSMGNGYDGYSMSNNARDAYAKGEKPKSKWTKNGIIAAVAEIDQSKADLLNGIALPVLKMEALRRTSWHHSSSWYNETDFYSVDEDFVTNLNEESAKKLAAIKVGKEESKVYKGDFDYIEWQGTRNNPKAVKHHLENVTIEERGSFYYVTDAEGNTIKKKIGSNGTEATDYEEEAKKAEEIKRLNDNKRKYTTPAAKEFLGFREYTKEEDGIDGYYFDRSKFDISVDGNVYVMGRKPSRMDYAIGLENFLNVGEKRAVKNIHGGYSIETWNGKSWERENEPAEWSEQSDIRYSFADEAKALILKKRPDLIIDESYLKKMRRFESFKDATPYSKIDEVVSSILKFPETKSRKAALNWLIKGAIILPEDAPKVTQAIEIGDASFKRVKGLEEIVAKHDQTIAAAEKNLAEQTDPAKIERAKARLRNAQERYEEAMDLLPKTKGARYDPLSYASPMEMIEALHQFKPREKPINPDTVPELSDKRDMGNGVVTYLVQDDLAGQQAMRRIINTHFGEDANPWCLLHGDGHGNLSDGSNGGYDAWYYWNHYNALPKRVAFKDGKLLAFMATDRGGELGYLEEEDNLRDAFPQYADEYDNLVDNEDYAETFAYYLKSQHGAEYAEATNPPEQWWDRKDSSHEGIPLGNMEVPNDPFGRWADFEIVNGELKQVSNFQKGDVGGVNYTKWYDSGFKSEEMSGKDITTFEHKEWDEDGSIKTYKVSNDTRVEKYFSYVKGSPVRAFLNGRSYIKVHFEDSKQKDVLQEAERIFAENDQRRMAGKTASMGDGATRYSLSSGLTAAGLTYETDEDGSLKIVLPNGKRVTKDTPAIAQDILGIDSPLMYLIDLGITRGTIGRDKEEGEKIKKNIAKSFAECFNLAAKWGDTADGVNAVDAMWRWVGDEVFKAIKSNSDAQYGTSVDILTICKKTDMLMQVVSDYMKKTKRGAMPTDIMNLYLETGKAAYQTPCPVCYVFSRWIRAGYDRQTAWEAQNRYADLVKKHDPKTPEGKAFWKAEYEKWNIPEAEKQTPEQKARDRDITAAKQTMTLGYQLFDRAMRNGNKAEADRINEDLRRAFEVLRTADLAGFIKYCIYDVDNDVAWGDFAEVPADVLFDFRASADIARHYPALRRFYGSKGSAGGKAIETEANNDFGDLVTGVATDGGIESYETWTPEYEQALVEKSNERGPDRKKTSQANAATSKLNSRNWLKIAYSYPEGSKERNEALWKFNKQFDSAIAKSIRQRLIGGQRFFSWSDNRVEFGFDMMMNLLQIQILGDSIQSYSKQLEGAELLTKHGAYNNGSLMGAGNGLEEAQEGEEGAVLLNGKWMKLKFSDIQGINHEQLFALNKLYDKSGNILVGMNDDHIRVALRDDRIFFVIPWHASGLGTGLLDYMLESLGEDAHGTETDYSSVQSEKVLNDSGVGDGMTALYDRAANSGKKFKSCFAVEHRKGEITESQKQYRKLREAILKGTATQADIDLAMKDEFLSQIVIDLQESAVAIGGKKADGNYVNKKLAIPMLKMTGAAIDSVYPYEYWDRKSTYKTSSVNSARYLEYCRRLGRLPKFCGMFVEKGVTKDNGYGDFTDEANYWKLLIDRRMYAINGKYQHTTQVEMSTAKRAFDVDTINPETVEAKWGKLITKRANSEQVGAIVDNVIRSQRAQGYSLAPTEAELKEGRQLNNNERQKLVEVDNVAKAKDYARAFIAASIMQGKDVTAKDAEKLLKGLRVTDDPEKVLSDAKAIASARSASISRDVKESDPELIASLAKNAMQDRFDRAMSNAMFGGAQAADPALGRELEKIRQRILNRQLDEAHGFTQAEMRSELYVNLSAALFKIADTPEELENYRAFIEAQKKAREERKNNGETEEQIEEDIAKLFDENGNLINMDQYGDERKPVPEEVKKLLDAIMAGADKRDQRRARAEEARRKRREEAKKKEAEAKTEDEKSEADAEADVNFGEETIDEETFDLLKPVFRSSDQFACFIEEWVFRKLKQRNAKLIGSTAFSDPVNLHELKNTAKDILRNLAKDTLGTTPARIFAERQIDRIMDYKHLRQVHNHIAYVFSRIHENALRVNRNRLIKDLVKEMRKMTGANGRMSNTTEEKDRKVFAKTELWVRSLIPYLTMSEEKLQEERERLQGVLDKYNSDATYEDYKDVDRNYQEAMLKLTLLENYGGMKRWMIGDIIDASNEILTGLSNNIELFMARQEAIRTRNKGIRDALIAAMEEGYSHVGKGKWQTNVNKLLNGLDSTMGNIELRLKDLIKYCQDPALKAAAEKAIQEIMFRLGRGTELFNITLAQGRTEVNAMLTKCYGSADAGIKHLQDEVPQEIEDAVFQQNGVGRHTYGQLLQLYGSIIQQDYHENVVKHGRDQQLDIIKNALTAEDIAFHRDIVQWNKDSRMALSQAVEEITGLPVRSPDENYIAVRPLNEPDGFSARVKAWNPITASLSNRVRHGKDFDERADILTMLNKAVEDRAHVIGYGSAGIFLRDTIAHRDVQKAGREFADDGQMKRIIDQLTDTLTQARPDDGTLLTIAKGARQMLSLAYLSWNVVSGAKQLGSFSVWANTVGLKNMARYMVNIDFGAIEELMKTDGYKARYVLGWTPETQEILRNPNPNKLKALWEKGMMTSQFFDRICCLWMAQGVYRDLKQSLAAELNEDGTALYTPEEAAQRAATITWNWCEQGQQTGREEYKNELQRRNSVGSFFYHFMTAPLLQLNYELAAFRKVALTKGRTGKAELARAVLVNHVIIPAAFQAIIAFFQFLGFKNRPEDDEEWMEQMRDEFLGACAMGSFNALFMVCQFASGIWNAATGGKRPDSQSLPVDTTVRFAYDGAKLIAETAKYGMTELGWSDFAEISPDDIFKDLLKVGRDFVAPLKQADNIKKRWSGSNLIGE